MDLQERFRGCLLGLAVGDALGMPVEGLTAVEIKAKFGRVTDMMPASPDHFHFGLKAGQFTDDTEETLILAKSIIECSGFSGDRFSQKMIEWGRTWAFDEKLARGAGFATRASIEQMISGKDWRESGAMIPTCGSAMRSAPVGLLYNCDLSLVSMYADLQSISTHCGAPARAASIAVAAGVALSLKDFPAKAVLERAAGLASRVDREFAERLSWVASLMSLEPQDAFEAIGCSPMASETVPAAFYCFLKFEPEEALIAAASNGGDSDSIASIAGSLIGASKGTSWIPERWLSCLEGRERIERVSRDLAGLASSFCG